MLSCLSTRYYPQDCLVPRRTQHSRPKYSFLVSMATCSLCASCSTLRSSKETTSLLRCGLFQVTDHPPEFFDWRAFEKLLTNHSHPQAPSTLPQIVCWGYCKGTCRWVYLCFHPQHPSNCLHLICSWAIKIAEPQSWRSACHSLNWTLLGRLFRW